ncbi:hypothetical protein AQUCO_01400513v1 [Aquilegia coerulea]|uniref:Uncharacterized protein n=1 Tax=Aquilegia coerulea TaxID=218851 RepID=A0A2G5DWS4_AQUCA|nr:hypothetical protein AQUCO_01400513v1 [Aquilegia coerulea]
MSDFVVVADQFSSSSLHLFSSLSIYLYKLNLSFTFSSLHVFILEFLSPTISLISTWTVSIDQQRDEPSLGGVANHCYSIHLTVYS